MDNQHCSNSTIEGQVFLTLHTEDGRRVIIVSLLRIWHEHLSRQGGGRVGYPTAEAVCSKLGIAAAVAAAASAAPSILVPGTTRGTFSHPRYRSTDYRSSVDPSAFGKWGDFLVGCPSRGKSAVIGNLLPKRRSHDTELEGSGDEKRHRGTCVI